MTIVTAFRMTVKIRLTYDSVIIRRKKVVLGYNFNSSFYFVIEYNAMIKFNKNDCLKEKTLENTDKNVINYHL